MKYLVKFQHEITVDIEADGIKAAEIIAHKLRTGYPAGTVKLLSIFSADCVEPPTKSAA